MTPTKPQAKLLRSILNGAHIEASRAYPHPHRWHVVNTADGRKGVELTESTVLTFVDRGWVKPEPKDAAWDTIAYPLTFEGRAVAGALPEPRGKQRVGAG